MLLDQSDRLKPQALENMLVELIASQVVLVQSMAELAESIRVLAEAIGEPEAGEESMVMSRR